MGLDHPVELQQESILMGEVFAKELAKALKCHSSELMIHVETYGRAHWTIGVSTTSRSTRGIAESVSSSVIVEMPGCCGICISTGARVEPQYRNLGIGSIMNKIRIWFANSIGYSTMICTDVMDNTAQQVILKKNGWEHIASFINKRSGNDIGIHIVPLQKESKLITKGTFSFARHSFLTKRHVQREREAQHKALQALQARHME